MLIFIPGEEKNMHTWHLKSHRSYTVLIDETFILNTIPNFESIQELHFGLFCLVWFGFKVVLFPDIYDT